MRKAEVSWDDFDADINFIAAPHNGDLINRLKEFSIVSFSGDRELEEYVSFLKRAFNPMRLFNEKFLPKKTRGALRLCATESS